MKRITSIILTICLVVSSVLTSAPIVHAEMISGTDKGFACVITDGEACVTGMTSTVGQSVVIPETLCGYPVTGIGSRAFWQCENLTSVTIPKGVEYIGSEAFGYTSLKDVTLPDGVISIGYGAFWCCDDLRTISIPNSVKYIGSLAFECCDELTGLIIPNSVEEIGSMILNGCDGIKYISIPFLGFEKEDAQTAKIGYLFSPIEDFEAVPGGLKRVELTNTEYVSDFAFAGCHYIQEIILPDGVKYIGEGAFSSCVAMETLVLPQSITTIGVEAFKLCNFESINIPSNVKKIGSQAFYRCDELNEFYYCGTEAQWNAIEFGSNNEALTSLERQGHKWGSWEADDEYIYRHCAFCNVKSAPISQTSASFQYRSRSKKYLVSEEQLSEPWIMYDTQSGYKHTGMRTTIAAQDDSEEMSAMYSACRHSNMERVNWYFYTNYVEGVELPNTGFYATEEEFNAMDALDTVGYRSNGKTYYRYKYCTSIDYYTDYYYYMWTDWTSWGDTIYTPDDDTEVEIREIYAITYDANGGVNTPNIQIKIYDEECTLSSSIPQNDDLIFLGWATTPNGYVEYQPGDTYTQNAAVTLYAVWNTVQSIAVNTIPNKTEYELGEELDTTGLTLTVTHIDGNTEEISEGFSVSGFDSTYAGTQTIWVRYNFSSTSFKVIVNGKNNLTWSIDGDGTLIISGIGEMTNWGVEDSPWYEQSSMIKTVVIGNGITSIGSNAFTDCYNLTSVEIPSSVKEICHHAFYACTSLESLIIPNGVKKIGDYSFIICENLESITIPDSVETIGADVFFFSNISDIYYGGTQDEWNAIEIDDSNDDLDNATIHFTNKYKITYNANGGTGAPASSTKVFDEVISLSALVPTWENHKFLGWSTSAEGDVEYAPGTEYSVNEDITLYAIWHIHIYDNGCDADCNECGEIRYASHSYGEWEITQEPTCASNGSKHKECILCGDMVTEVISKTNNHSYSILVFAPTCTEQGYTAHSCDICGDFYSDSFISTLGHKYDNDCDANCNICGFTRVTNHSFDAWIKVDDENHKHICACGHIETEAHSWNEGTITIPPTHTTLGKRTYTCEKCSATKTEKIDMIVNHSYSEWVKVDAETHSRSCICGDTETNAHSWDEGVITIPSTHTSFGECIYTCEECSAIKTEQIAKIIDHSYSKWIKADDETHSRSCICGETERNTHNWDDGTITIQPTDTTYGEKTYTCIDCLATKTEQMDKNLEVSSGVCGKDLTWTLYSNGELIIDGTGDMYDYKYYNNKCTSPWNAWKSSIKTVIIKDGVTSVGAYAFYWYYESLEKAEIAGTVSSIGNYAFYRCYSLTDLTIAEGVTTIGQSAFEKCSFITLTIPNSVTTISSSAFNYCPKLTDIDLGRNIKQIYSSAFNLCPIKNVWCSGSYDDYSECRAFGISDLSMATWHYDNCFGVYQEKSHIYSEWTNHNEVQHKKSCECGDVVYSDHNWDDGIVTKEPTHKTTGIITHTCNICNGEKTTIIAEQPHEFSEWLCISETEHSRTCMCGEVETSHHNWDDGIITKQPTQTDCGENTFTCGDCLSTKKELIYPYIVAYDANGGITVPTAQIKIPGVDLMLSNIVPVRDGYIFKGWTANTTGEIYKSLSVSNLEGLHYAVGPYEEYNVSCPGAKSISLTFDERTEFDGDYLYLYDCNDNLFARYTKKQLSGITVIVPGDSITLKRQTEYYTDWGFAVTSAIAEFEIYSAGGSYDIDESVTLYAVWEELNKYSVIYDANGGTNAPDSQFKIQGTDLILTDLTPVREGYLFQYWSIVPDGTTQKALSVVGIESEHNYTNNTNAEWTISSPGAKSIKLTFDSRTKFESKYDFLSVYDSSGTCISKYSGNELAGQTIEIEGEFVKLLLTSDYSNNYWGFKITSAEAYYDVYNSGDSYDIDENVTLYAIWKVCSHQWDSGTVTLEPTCIIEGIKTFICNDCGEKKTEEVPTNEHNEVPITNITPTFDNCGQVGGTKCSNCGITLTEPTTLKPTGPLVTAILSSNGTLTISGGLSDNKAAEGATFVAVYDSFKRMITLYDASDKDQSNFTIPLVNCGDAHTVKIMRWQIGNLRPFHNAVEVNVIKE